VVQYAVSSAFIASSLGSHAFRKAAMAASAADLTATAAAFIASSVMALARRADLSRVLRQRLELPGHGAVMPLAAVLEGIRQPVFSRRPLLDQPHHHGAAVCPALGVGFPFRFGHGPTPTR